MELMKKLIIVFLVVLALSLAVVSPVLAGGDQVRGEKGQGEVYQNFDTDNPPFEP
jgi:predicted small secreted protein